MSKKITIAIDAMGGDNSPDKTVEGVSIFLKKNNLNDDFYINLYVYSSCCIFLFI